MLSDLYNSVEADMLLFRKEISEKEFSLSMTELINQQALVLFNRDPQTVVATQHGFLLYGIQ